MQNMLLFFLSFFLSSHHDTNPLLHLYHFRKKYNYILANINSGSSRVIFSFFFCIHQVGQTFLYPSKFLYTTYVLVSQNCTLIFSRTRKQNWIIICQCCLRIWRAGRGWGGGGKGFIMFCQTGSDFFLLALCVCVWGGGGGVSSVPLLP